jgi:outer membrane protein insertion porin family
MASDVRYVRFFGQYFIYRLIGDSLTYAAGLRVGLGRGLGEDLVPSERFFAGGSSSLRGFDYHEVGPKNPHTGNPQGGNAVFILNQELRFPIYKIFSGVVFLDTGNVYPLISDFDPLNVRETAGFGFRLDLGFVLARMDLGFKLDRLAGEPLYHIHFSLGQAF